MACPRWDRNEELWVAFPKAEELFHRRVRVREVIAPPDEQREVQDVALLVLEEDVPHELAARLRQPSPDDLVGRSWWSFGFPDGMLGNSSDGIVGEALGYGWIRLDTGSRYPVQAGYSGAAVWSPRYEAVVGMVGQARGQTGDARALTLRWINRYLAEQKLHQLADWSVEAAGESALAAWGWSLETDPEADRHWRPRARGVSVDTQGGFRFRGRTVALAAIVSWITGDVPRPRVLVVTGSPGAGKSAVLGRIVTTADPHISAALPPEDTAERAPVHSVSCAVHAKGKTALEVAREIARAASAALPDDVGDLVPALRASLADSPGRGFRVVIDALDEATTPAQARVIIRKIALPLVKTCADLDVRIVVGSRATDDDGDLLAVFGAGAEILDLDAPDYFAQDDLTAYALATLQLTGNERPGNPYADRHVAVPVAEAIAARADGNFLIAGLIAHSHGLHDRQPIAPARISSAPAPTVDTALRDYLTRLPPICGVSAVDVLTSLAYAEAPGLSPDLWRTAIASLTGTALPQDHLVAFARSSAANFLVEASAPDSASGVYRLFHQALNDTLLHARTEAGSIRTDERSLARGFLSHGLAGGWHSAPDYLLRSLPRHAARGGVIDELLADDVYPLHADLRRLIPAAAVASSPDALVRARLLRKTPRAIDATPSVRAALFSVTEAQEHLGSTYRENRFSAPYQAMWAEVTPRFEEVVLEGHTGAVRALCAVAAGDRTLLATAGDDGTVRFWDPASGEHVRTLVGHTDRVKALCVLPAGDRTLLATASADRTVRLWDPASGEHVRTLGHGDRVEALCAVPVGDRDLLATAGGDDTVRVWDPAGGELVRTLDGHTDGVSALRAVAVGDRTLLAVGCGDGTVRVRDPAGGELVRTLKGHNDRVEALCAVSADDNALLAIVDGWGRVRLWNPATGRRTRPLRNYGEFLVQLMRSGSVVSSELPLVVTSGDDGTVRMVDPVTGRNAGTLRGHTERVNALCAVPGDHPVVATASDDGTVRLWDPDARGIPVRGKDHTDRVNVLCAVAAGDRALLAGGRNDGTVRLWDPATGKQTRSLHRGPTTLNRLANTIPPVVQLAVFNLQIVPGVFGVCAVAAGGRDLLATTYWDTVRLWDPARGKHIRGLKGHAGSVELCAVPAGDRTLLAVAGLDTTVRLQNPVSGKHVCTLEGHTDQVTALCAVPAGDRTLLATASADRTVRLWDPVSGEHVRTLEHGDRVGALCAVPASDRSLLATAGDDGVVRLWNPETGGQTRTLRGHSRRVKALCAVPAGDRTLLATAGDDATVRLWNPETYRPVEEIPVRYPVTALAEADGFLAVGLGDGVLVLRLSVNSPAEP
ncbi:WD40 repeat domain-containing protein [Streptomyces sp. NPDC004838]